LWGKFQEKKSFLGSVNKFPLSAMDFFCIMKKWFKNCPGIRDFFHSARAFTWAQI
jgi:hypothetical protein